MKMISGGLGVSALAVTHTAMTLYMNNAMAASCGDGLTLKAAKQVDGHWEFEFQRDRAGPVPHALEVGKGGGEDASYWTRRWSNRQKAGPLPRFGKTRIAGLSATDRGFIVTMPATEKLMPVAHRVGPRSRKQIAEAAPPASGLERLGDLVKQVNARKAELGDALCLEVTAEGKLRALVEYS